MKPVRFLIVLVALHATLGTAQAQTTAAKFDSFYSKFTTAVASRDTQTLQQMMANDFEFFTTKHASPAEVFQGLAVDGGLQWGNLQSAVQGDAPVIQKYHGKASRLVTCTPTQVIYNCFVVFQQDNAGRWRWKGMVMPEK